MTWSLLVQRGAALLLAGVAAGMLLLGYLLLEQAFGRLLHRLEGGVGRYARHNPGRGRLLPAATVRHRGGCCPPAARRGVAVVPDQRAPR